MAATIGADKFAVTLNLRNGFEFEADLGDEWPAFTLDEPPPLGEGAGPDPLRLLATAIGQCLGGSLLFCLRKSRVDVRELRIRVRGTTGRNAEGRLRVGGLTVELVPMLNAEQEPRLTRCLEVFEDFCTVTASVRQGVGITVDVQPRVPTKT